MYCEDQPEEVLERTEDWIEKDLIWVEAAELNKTDFSIYQIKQY